MNLVEALKTKGADVNVLFREGVDPEQFFAGKNKIVFSLACYRHLRKIRPEVIHTHGTWYCLLPGAFYKKLHGCTLVHTFHTEPDKQLSLPAKEFFQGLLNACDCVTFGSMSLQEKVIEIDNFCIPSTAITYAGVKAGKISHSEIELFSEQFSIGKDAIVLLAIGMTALSHKAKWLKS